MWTLLAVLSLASLALAQDCAVGMTEVVSGYEYTCMQDEDGFTYKMASGCVHPADGSVQAGSAVFEDSYYMYECKVLEDLSVGLEIIGCVSNGKKVEEGGKVEIGNYVWTCVRHEAGYLQIQPSGCIVDGGEIPIGESFDLGGFWYTCMAGPLKKLEGCVTPEGSRIANGEFYFKNGFTVTCQCSEKSCSHKVTGCEEMKMDGSPAPRSVGEEWLQGVSPFQYKCKCSTCSQGTTIVRTVPFCTEMETKIEPGCMKSVGGKFIGCGINTEQTLQIITDTQDALSSQGFKQC